jgi:hypothetical protein
MALHPVGRWAQEVDVPPGRSGRSPGVDRRKGPKMMEEGGGGRTPKSGSFYGKSKNWDENAPPPGKRAHQLEERPCQSPKIKGPEKKNCQSFFFSKEIFPRDREEAKGDEGKGRAKD